MMNETRTTAAAELPQSRWVDWAGMIASIGCAIHCAAMPVILAYLPALGLEWLAGQDFHRLMAVVCFALAASAFVPGLRNHGSVVPAIWGATGLLLLTTAAFSFEGNCCAACESEQVESIRGPGYSDVSCRVCQSARNVAALSSNNGSMLASLTPLVTPLGGLLLVVGHVSNHLRSCRCQKQNCCLA